jgi:hypothetical protein
MELGTNRLGNFSFNARRAFLAIALVPFLLSLANLFLEWHWFGQYDKQIVVGCSVVGFLVLRYLGPTVSDAKKYRDAKRASNRTEL